MDLTTCRPAVARSRPFYGWAVVAGTFTVLFIGFGTAYSFAAFFQALRDEFQGSRADISLVFGITGFLYFSLGAVSGPLADRFGPRRVVAAGVLLIAAGVLIASRAQALWQVYLTYSLGVGLGVGFAYVPAISAVQRWFVRRRGVASGMAVAGIGVGNLVMPPVAAALIDRTDWRTAYVLLGLVALGLGLAAAALIEHSPQRRGLLPDGGPTA
ncbi:MAG: MFS transporter, partial [Chloroflexota bacterium]